jgi:hypothetical protein
MPAKKTNLTDAERAKRIRETAREIGTDNDPEALEQAFKKVVARHKPPMPHWNGVTDCQVLVVEPNERLSYSWNASGEEAPKGLKTVVTWTLTPTTGGNLAK